MLEPDAAVKFRAGGVTDKIGGGGAGELTSAGVASVVIWEAVSAWL